MDNCFIKKTVKRNLLNKITKKQEWINVFQSNRFCKNSKKKALEIG